MYIGVKDFIQEFKDPFDSNAKAKKIATAIIKERGEKITNEILKEEIANVLAEWDKKRTRGERVQRKLCDLDIKQRPENTILGGRNEFSNDKNFEGLTDKTVCTLENKTVYLEKLLYSSKLGIRGYADKIFIDRNTINILDNKVVDKIYRTSSFKTNTGMLIKGSKMYPPLEHLDDCNYSDMCLQVSLYMYLSWMNNKNLKIGKLFIRHIRMNDKDKITSDKLIEVPYLKDEIIKMLKYKKLNDE